MSLALCLRPVFAITKFEWGNNPSSEKLKLCDILYSGLYIK